MRIINSLSGNGIAYLESIDYLSKQVALIKDSKAKELLWLLHHPSTYTAGSSSKIEDIQTNVNAPIVKTNRGGQITYHGPGQLIIYLAIDLVKRDLNVRQYMHILQNWGLAVLQKNWQIQGKIFNDNVGIWVCNKLNQNNCMDHLDEFSNYRKIGALGVRVTKGIAWHGLSFNINNQVLPYFNQINPCGLSSKTVTTLQKELSVDLNITPLLSTVGDAFLSCNPFSSE